MAQTDSQIVSAYEGRFTRSQLQQRELEEAVYWALRTLPDDPRLTDCRVDYLSPDSSRVVLYSSLSPNLVSKRDGTEVVHFHLGGINDFYKNHLTLFNRGNKPIGCHLFFHSSEPIPP